MGENFDFIFIYSKQTSFLDFKSRLDSISKSSKVNIVAHLIEKDEVEEKVSKIKDPKMICSSPLEAPIVGKVLEKFPNIKWVHSLYAGVDKFLQIDKIGKNNEITLTNARGAYSDALGEYSVLAILYFNYHVPQYITAFENKEWKRIIDNQLVNKKTICIIGYGQNGIGVAKRVKYAFNMHVIGIVRTMRDNIEGKEFCNELYDFSQMNENIIGKSDFILATLPETKETINIFDSKFFNKMNKNAVFINIGRGTAVVEDDLYEALTKETIRGAVLDVTQKEPLEKESKLYTVSENKLLITNHTGDRTDKYDEQCYDVLLKNIEEYVTRKKLITVVKKDIGY